MKKGLFLLTAAISCVSFATELDQAFELTKEVVRRCQVQLIKPENGDVVDQKGFETSDITLYGKFNMGRLESALKDPVLKKEYLVWVSVDVDSKFRQPVRLELSATSEWCFGDLTEKRFVDTLVNPDLQVGVCGKISDRRHVKLVCTEI